MDKKKEYAELRDKLVGYYYYLHSLHRDPTFHVGLRSPQKIEEILLAVKRIVELEPSLQNRKTKRLILNLESGFSSKVQDWERWHLNFYIGLEDFITLLGIKRQKKETQDWGPFLFSSVFPRAWSYLKEYVPNRHPEFVNVELHDLKVYAFSVRPSLYLEASRYGTLNYCARYHPTFFGKGVIEISLASFDPQKKPLENVNDVLKLLRFIDSIPKYRSIVIHEYEHSIQRRWGRYKTSLPKNVGVEQNVFRDLVFKFKPLNFAYQKVKNDVKELTYRYHLGSYWFNPLELEARLAERIHNLVQGYSHTEISKMEGLAFTESIAKLEVRMKELEAGKEKLLQQLLYEKLEKEKKQKIKNDLNDFIYQIALLKQTIADYTYLISEADRVAEKIFKGKEIN